MFDVTTGQSQQVAQHDAPVKVVKWVDTQGGILATGSWDKTIKVQDPFSFFHRHVVLKNKIRTFLVLGPTLFGTGS
jgi:hypothetical protein